MAPAGRAQGRDHGISGPQGLYDSHFEHDACGVAFIADLTGQPGHDVVSKALTALCNLQHRGAEGGDPGTGDGAGILTQIPDAFFREVCDFDLPPAGSYAAGLVFLDKETAGTQRGQGGHRPARRGREPGRPRLARRPAPPGGLRPRRARRTAPPRAALPGRHRPAARDRAGADGVLPAQAGPAAKRYVLREPVVADHRVQGDAVAAPGPAVFPGPVRRAVPVRAGPGPLAVLHQHVPVLAARAPVPVHRAQRRDQYRAGQPELDAGPRGDAGQQPDPGLRRRARHRPGLPGAGPRRQRLRQLRRMPGTAAHGRPVAAARDTHDDP